MFICSTHISCCSEKLPGGIPSIPVFRSSSTSFELSDSRIPRCSGVSRLTQIKQTPRVAIGLRLPILFVRGRRAKRTRRTRTPARSTGRRGQLGLNKSLPRGACSRGAMPWRSAPNATPPGEFGSSDGEVRERSLKCLYTQLPDYPPPSAPDVGG